METISTNITQLIINYVFKKHGEIKEKTQHEVIRKNYKL